MSENHFHILLHSCLPCDKSCWYFIPVLLLIQWTNLTESKVSHVHHRLKFQPKVISSLTVQHFKRSHIVSEPGLASCLISIPDSDTRSIYLDHRCCKDSVISRLSFKVPEPPWCPIQHPLEHNRGLSRHFAAVSSPDVGTEREPQLWTSPRPPEAGGGEWKPCNSW